MRLILSGTGAILLDFWPEIGAAPRLYLETRFFEVNLYIYKWDSSNLYFGVRFFEPILAIFTRNTLRTCLLYFAVRLFELNLINKIIKIGR